MTIIIHLNSAQQEANLSKILFYSSDVGAYLITSHRNLGE